MVACYLIFYITISALKTEDSRFTENDIGSGVLPAMWCRSLAYIPDVYPGSVMTLKIKLADKDAGAEINFGNMVQKGLFL